jgi:hypothetical protein
MVSFSNSSHFVVNSGNAKNKPVTLPPGCAKLATVCVFDRVGFQVHGHDRNRRGLRSKRLQHCRSIREDDIDVGSDDLGRHRSDPRRIPVGDAQDQLDLRRREIPARPQPIHHRLDTNRDCGLRTRVEHAHARHTRSLLRARCERPSGRCAAE